MQKKHQNSRHSTRFCIFGGKEYFELWQYLGFIVSNIFLQLSILIVSGYSLSINLVHKDGAQKGEFKVEFFCKNKQLFLDVLDVRQLKYLSSLNVLM